MDKGPFIYDVSICFTILDPLPPPSANIRFLWTSPCQHVSDFYDPPPLPPKVVDVINERPLTFDHSVSKLVIPALLHSPV